ncbi:hypothetical protein J2Z21_008011 [Streptomyces griseochromogenes]|uniref:Uncharacterized protein n=1 Tax=Streptomyces griseochromogenes TaxID=68214 RepID=A0ABS4M5Q3_9ACTN|nr:hypothetical protein [Streptomyces griseochromogenes]
MGRRQLRARLAGHRCGVGVKGESPPHYDGVPSARIGPTGHQERKGQCAGASVTTTSSMLRSIASGFDATALAQ